MSQESKKIKLQVLQERAECLALARHFFSERSITEVDCPVLLRAPSIDAYIDLIEASPFDEKRYLHTSPEYGMKRLIAMGMGDIFQLGHVFRDGERGKRHTPEFTMAEWYRIGITFEEMIAETVEFVQVFLGPLPVETLTYHEAFAKYTRVNPDEESDEVLNEVLGIEIEPQLGEGKLTVITHYPASQAALAISDGYVAERFEIYFQGVELANGYHELANAEEQRKRFEEANQKRSKPLPVDEQFLEALDNLPDCCGVAVGFDRLLMLRLGRERIDDILLFSWDEM